MNKNPIYEKELWSTERSKRITLSFFAFPIVMSVIALAVFLNMLGYLETEGEGNYAVMLQLYIMLSTAECFLILGIMPGMAGAGISQERERNTLELMEASGIEAYRLVLGKFMAYMNTAVVWILSGIPALSLVYVYGGIQIKDILWFVIVLLCIAAYICSISLLCSSGIRRTGQSVIVAYGIEILLVGGTLLIHYFPQMMYGKEYGAQLGSAIPWYQYLLLSNPFLTFYGVINKQAGTKTLIFDLINDQGNYRPNWVTDSWTDISLLLLLLSTIACLCGSVFILKRQRKRNRL